MRDAANAMLDALPLPPVDQKERLAKIARRIRHTQRVNAASRASHAKARQRELKALGIRIDKLRCCMPPPSG